MAFSGFGRDSGPNNLNLPNPFSKFHRPPSPTPTFSDSLRQQSPRSIEYPARKEGGTNSYFKDYDAIGWQQSSVLSPYESSPKSGAGIPGKTALFQDEIKTTSPPFPSIHETGLKNSSQMVTTRRPSYSPAGDNRPKSPGTYTNFRTHQDMPSACPYISGHYSEQRSAGIAGDQSRNRTKSPPFLSKNEGFHENHHPGQSIRSSLSPHRLGSGSSAVFSNSDTQSNQKFSQSLRNTDPEVATTKPNSSLVPKRARSPPFLHTNEIHQEDYSAQDGTEWEMQAKAKRLARFRSEIDQTSQSSLTNASQKLPSNGCDLSTVGRQKHVEKNSMEMVRDSPNEYTISDQEGMDPSSAIVGLCPDMCPESERAERERKGDLDQYERLDGDRNQTSKFLAIKKYTRTAEREAHLIRPMPVLQKTIDYLLSLLEQTYDDRFLGVYNFLWDRMRCIRMDLRMQHIFNLKSITMLEQMIRLHVIAMHELCEFTKGEGFSEGFDAHLNIEQMNKASVELFQMYDDHRKKGINVPTEREFRGYYALLKLDKHPGYKVEPAELSLDLAKMTPEIRQTPEVLFARDVARACRAGNFIAFFRLARKASYLQACLMHAHFAKLRTHALASLHSGLQSNQGLPVAHLANWLGMEEEEIESLLDYHGFLMKDFEESYLVKDRLFLNGSKDFPTKRSKLVQLKRSKRIVEDVSSFHPPVCMPAREQEVIGLSTGGDNYGLGDAEVLESGSSFPNSDEEMSDIGPVSSPRDGTKFQPVLNTTTVHPQGEDDQQMVKVNVLRREFSFQQKTPEIELDKVGKREKLNRAISFKASPVADTHSQVEDVPAQIVLRSVPLEISPASQVKSSMGNMLGHTDCAAVKDIEDEELPDPCEEVGNDESMATYYDEEVAEAKLKLIIRIWKRCALRRRESRNRRRLAANAALNFLSVGPPIKKEKDEPSNVAEFDIDRIMRERYEKLERSCSRLNVSEVIVDELRVRNPNFRCLCWKIVICSQHCWKNNVGSQSQASHFEASRWLLSKLMPMSKDDGANDDLVISSPGLSVWNKWVNGESDADLTCCLSIIKDAELDGSSETVSGAGAILFLVSESIPWDAQRMKLHSLLESLPSGTCLPLLILSAKYENDFSHLSSSIIDELKLYNLDKLRVSSWSVISLADNQQMEQHKGFFSNKHLIEGLQWLARYSPPQPHLSCLSLRELVLNNLTNSLKVLDKMSMYEVGPNHCISAFNEALDRSMSKIVAAANANPAGWPCPEMALLRESCELGPMCAYLPEAGWSSRTRIQRLIHALGDCKLPSFPDDISWLARSSGTGKELEQHGLQLENCLVKYLTRSCEMMGLGQGRQEAHVMLQKSTQLQLRNVRYYLVPKWVMLFRRIFNWRLTCLSATASSVAYVLQPESVSSTVEDLDKLEDDDFESLPYLMGQPSLDEMVEVGFDASLCREGQSEVEASKSPSRMVLANCEVREARNARQLAERNDSMQSKALVDTDDDDDSDVNLTPAVQYTSSELVVASKTAKEADTLSQLLAKCNLVQNKIDEKLSIYF